MNITAQMVSKLREQTGAGMMECKKALIECDGDFEKAVDLLRVRGKASAEKRAGRAAAEGVVAVYVSGDKAAMVELNSETDFVARNQEFRDAAAVAAVTAAASGTADVNALADAVTPAEAGPLAGKKVQEILHDLGARMRENIVLRRAAVMRAGPGEMVSGYAHTVTNKIGVLVRLTGDASNATHAEAARNVAMHIAASKPMCVSRDEVPADVLERERQVLTEKTRAENKPEAAIPKIVEGRLGKFYEQVCLLDQPYVRDPSVKVGQMLKDAGLTVLAFDMFVVGQE